MSKIKYLKELPGSIISGETLQGKKLFIQLRLGGLLWKPMVILVLCLVMSGLLSVSLLVSYVPCTKGQESMLGYLDVLEDFVFLLHCAISSFCLGMQI